MKVEQFVLAYRVSQDRLRALLPDGFCSLRPVLRINAEIRHGKTESVTLELNTAVAHDSVRGWLNIGHFCSDADPLSCRKDGENVTFTLPFLTISFAGTGVTGGCPAEKDNDGCYFLGEKTTFHKAEKILSGKEFCDCAFAWSYRADDARGVSERKTLPALPEEEKIRYPKEACTPENAAAIPCLQVLGAYRVVFERKESDV